MWIWLLVLFVLDLALSATAGELPGVEVERESRVTIAYIQFGAIVSAYIYLIGRQGLARRLLMVEEKARPVFILLGLWILFALTAAVEGFGTGNLRTYVLGDLYKFLLLPLYWGLAYFGLRTGWQVDRVLKGIAIILGLALIFDYVTLRGYIQSGYRFTASSVYHISTLSPLIIYLLFRRESSRLFRFIVIGVTIEALAAIVLFQGIGPYVYTILALTLYLLFWRKVKLALAGILLLAVAAWGIYGMELSGVREQSYALTKIQRAARVSGIELIAQRLGGLRLAQVLSIIDEFEDSPTKVPLGFGMGGFLDLVPLREVRAWAPEKLSKHYIESALFEVFYRSGLCGLIVLLGFLGYVFRRGSQVATGPRREFGIFVMVNALFQCANLAILSPLSYTWMILSVSLAGTFVVTQEESKVVLRTGYESSHFVQRLSAIGARERGRRSRFRQEIR